MSHFSDRFPTSNVISTDDWRIQFDQPTLPFMVVELSAYCNDMDQKTHHAFCNEQHSPLKAPDYHLPNMRMAQKSGETVKGVGVISAMDLGSLHPSHGSIHSDNKVPLGYRIALGIKNAVYSSPKESVVWEGPTVVKASASDGGGSGARGNMVVVTFETKSVDRLSLNSTAACPAVMLPVYCTGGGFELLIGGKWTAAESIKLGADQLSVLVAVPPSAVVPASDGGGWGGATRIRYAYADWPVINVRNNDNDGLPARLFDIPIE
jgi:hypothetical protein